MERESNFSNWVIRKLTVLKEGEDPDQRMIECHLVRTMADMRRHEVSSIKLSKDFNDKLLLKLDKEEMEACSWFEIFRNFVAARRPRSYILGSCIALSFAFLAVYSVYAVSRSRNSSVPFTMQTTPPKSEKRNGIPPTIELESQHYQILKNLEDYYTSSGNLHKASLIHSLIEVKDTSEK